MEVGFSVLVSCLISRVTLDNGSERGREVTCVVYSSRNI